MLVSVVIPVFNAEKWISETLASVFHQTYQQLELVLVDDGSTDRSVEVAEKSLRQSPFPYRVLRQPNAGAAAARNRGWRVARGPWIQFLDADDLLAPQKIGLQIALEQSKEKGDVIYSDWQKLILIDERWTPIDRRTPLVGSNALADVLMDQNFLQLGSILVKASILEGVGGFDSDHEPIEDVGLYVKIAIAGGVFANVKSEGPIAFYRDLPRSFSKLSQTKFIESCIKNAKLAEGSITNDRGGNSRAVEAIVDLYFAGARFFAGRDWNRFEELVAEIERLRPGFVPKAPRQLNVMSRIAGYRRAERIAVLYRRVKSIETVFKRDHAPG
jgi:glycosyltransferase involved in cell wall biosynthesis